MGRREQIPEVARIGVLNMQVCVPDDWTDEQILEFAESRNPAGGHMQWEIRQQGSKFLIGADARVACQDKTNFVHVTLDV